MSKRASVRRIGLFVLGALLIALGGVLALGWARFLRETLPFVMHFDDSVHGLRPGAPVRFKGVEVGRVVRLELPRQVVGEQVPIPVIVELDAAAILGEDGRVVFDQRRDLAGAVSRGLRAMLETESLLTGILFVSLDFEPDHKGRLYGRFNDLPEIPTVPRRMQALQDQARGLVAMLSQLDLKGLIDELRLMSAHLGELARMPELRRAVVSLDEALHAVTDMARSVEREVAPVSGELRETLAGLRGTLRRVDGVATRVEADIEPLMSAFTARMQGLAEMTEDFTRTLASVREFLDPRSPLLLLLADALDELARAARAVGELARTVERDPAVLLRGPGGAR